MNQFSRSLVLSFSLSIATIILPISAKANDLKGNFVKAPRLIDAHTTFSEIRVRQATYYFDIAIPKTAGASLQKITIAQREGGEQIKFRLDKTTAFLGDRRHKGESINLADITTDDSEETITIIFAKPVAPGTNLTVGLKPKRNPDLSGVYLFGVTAFPTGEQSYGLYLGAGRLQFIQSDDGFF
jgi:Protein of unknown function (DUF2808)